MSIRNAIVSGALLLSSFFVGTVEPVKASNTYQETVSYYYNDSYYDYYAPEGYVCTKQSPLNIRYGPSKEYPIYSTFAKGTELWWMDTAYDSYGNVWYQVTDGYDYGWVSGQYVCWY